MKTTVIFHSADWDGEFCHQIAKKFLPLDTEFIGWDFKDDPINPSSIGETLYVMDLPLDRPFGFRFEELIHDPEAKVKYGNRIGNATNIIWIDHHKSSIESHPTNIPGYRIDGVAACRLVWQYFTLFHPTAGSFSLPRKEQYVGRVVREPWAVRLAGEYDIWDKRDPDAELFQHGLRSRDLDGWWPAMLSDEATATIAEIENRLEQGSKFELLPNGNLKVPGLGERVVKNLLKRGEAIQFARANEYRDVITQQGFTVRWDGITFLACNSHELDIRSHLFEAGIKPEHEALLGFTFNGKSGDWRVSMYHIPGKEHIDILSTAKNCGGGGHAGACGCRLNRLPFLP